MQTREVNGLAVRELRKALGIKAVTFAADCNISPGYLTRIEQGLRKPSPPVALALAIRLGVSLDAISCAVPTHAQVSA